MNGLPMNELEKENYLIQIRDKLRKDSVKLWLPPYMIDSAKTSEEFVKKISEDYSEKLKIPFEICLDLLKELQESSLWNLQQRNKFKESGLATIKIKLLHLNNPPRNLIKELCLTMRTIDLKNVLVDELDLSSDGLKLICSGKVLKDDMSLDSQGVKNGHQIMAIVLAESPDQVIDRENEIKDLENTKTDSRLLALDDEYMQLEDQFGNAIKIPPNERKALIVAMALHEKGKTALKRNDYHKALVFFLEADQEFKNCNSQLLKTVDNYALLDLDLAWCYLCLESFVQLPEASERLKRCEGRLHSIYGQNMERLIAVKGTGGNEEALFARLHLLQAIVLYHQNNRTEALTLLKKVEEEIRNLKIDEQSMMILLELGYTAAEATVGLRATRGDVNRAANYINENREKREESRKKAEAELILEKEKKKLGLCDDGKQYVDPNFLKILVNMGYNKEVARQALKKNNNIISDSIQYIQENPGPSGSKSTELLAFIEDLVPELVAAGFDPRMAKLALQQFDGDIIKAAEELLANDGIVSGDLSKMFGSESVENIIKKRKETKEEKSEAFKRLRDDIETVDDDHLDINLVQEEMFLKQYLSLLEK